jgi:hypothetical protein
MIDGCMQWQQMGLAPPEAVTRATEAHLQAEDALAAWMDVGPQARSAGFGRVRFLVLVLPCVTPHSSESPAHRPLRNFGLKVGIVGKPRRSFSMAIAFDCSSWRWVSSIRSF